MAELFDPLGLMRALEEDFHRLNRGLADGAPALVEMGTALGQELRELDAAHAPAPEDSLPGL